MSNIIKYIENSIFLGEHKGIQNFINYYFQNYELHKNQDWVVLCERREDIVTVRNEIIQQLKSPAIISGIKIYTPDTLSAKICTDFHHIQDNKIRNKIPKSLFKPYIDLQQQEKIVEIILNIFGYTDSDSLAIAKQILTLIDIDLPFGTNYIDLLLESQNLNKTNSIQNITELSLKQILATIQSTKIEFSEYARFQTLVKDYLNHDFLNHILLKQQDELFPTLKKIVLSNFLWIEAPEYEFSLEGKNEKSIKPGNFQSYLVNDFKKNLINFIENNNKNNNKIFISKTYLNNSENENKIGEIDVKIYMNEEELFFDANETIKNHNNKIILADLNPNNFQYLKHNGNGIYKITKKDFDYWLSNKIDHNQLYIHKIKFIDKKFDEFIEIFSYIKNHEIINKICNIYGLMKFNFKFENDKKSESPIDLFSRKILREDYLINEDSELNKLPKVLSFYNGKKPNNFIQCIGRPHTPVGQTFNVKILNQLFYNLKQKGVEIEIPANEIMYKLFWKNLASEIKTIQFLLLNKNDIEKFPNYIKINKISHRNSKICQNTIFRLQDSKNLFNKVEAINNWKKKFSFNQKSVSITQFEDYVNCPHKFFLKHVLNIQKDEYFDSINQKSIGIKMHKICEILITNIVVLFGNNECLNVLKSIFNSIITELKNENIFLSFDKNDWFSVLNFDNIQNLNDFEKESIKNTFCQCIDIIWDCDKNDSEMSFIELQEREIIKRTFYKFLLTEVKNISNNKKIKIGIYREFPIFFEFFGLNLSGRIDRIDLTNDGLEIIDYKTSKVSKSTKEIEILPNKMNSMAKSRISVQGAMYCYGLAKSFLKKTKSEDEDYIYNSISMYSLYYLKNLDEDMENCFQYIFQPRCENNNAKFEEIKQSYQLYAENLVNGDFTPKPIQNETTCLFCEYKTLCPNTYSSNYKSQNQVEL
jgi:hypothetical protein